MGRPAEVLIYIPYRAKYSGENDVKKNIADKIKWKEI